VTKVQTPKQTIPLSKESIKMQVRYIFVFLYL